MTRTNPEMKKIATFAVSFEAGLFLIACVLAWLLGIPLFGHIRFTWFGAIAGAVATGPMLLGMWWCSNSKLKPLRDLMTQVDEWIVPIFLGTSPLTLFGVSVLAGLGEECLFRGVLNLALSDWIGMPVAVLTTSILFGLAHLITPTYAILAGIIGVYLGILTAATDNLLVPIVAHTLYDYVALTYLLSRTRFGTEN